MHGVNPRSRKCVAPGLVLPGSIVGGNFAVFKGRMDKKQPFVGSDLPRFGADVDNRPASPDLDGNSLAS